MKKAGGIFPSKVFIRVFKAEDELELWGLKGDKYIKIVTWPICSRSGGFGPKVKQGDGQVPEGFYTIDRFNPSSSYYLSLGVSYPNTADSKRNPVNPGGDIFIHGNCVTIGCIPITDSLIEYLYWTCVQSYGQGNSIPVHIFPCKLTDKVIAGIPASSPWKSFWLNLEKGYTYFEQKRVLPKVTVNVKGNMCSNSLTPQA